MAQQTICTCSSAALACLPWRQQHLQRMQQAGAESRAPSRLQPHYQPGQHMRVVMCSRDADRSAVMRRRRGSCLPSLPVSIWKSSLLRQAFAWLPSRMSGSLPPPAAASDSDTRVDGAAVLQGRPAARHPCSSSRQRPSARSKRQTGLGPGAGGTA